MELQFRNLMLNDVEWMTEVVNDPEVAKYSLSIYPKTQHNVEERLIKNMEEKNAKHVVAEFENEPAGTASLEWQVGRRNSHIAWLGIDVRKKHWGKGVGSALIQEIIRVAKELGFRKIVLGVFEGNERGLRLYKKFGFKREAYEKDMVWIDGSWRESVIMGLELAPCIPYLKQTHILHDIEKRHSTCNAHMCITHLENHDLEEVNRLQNCVYSTKSSSRIPPVTKEQTKQWYEGIDSKEQKHCLACLNNDKLLGYLQFEGEISPFSCLKFEEIIVDVNQRPYETTMALIDAIKSFKERYGYRRISTYISEISHPIIDALEDNGFKKTGIIKGYYYVDGYYTNALVYGYP